MLNIPSLCDCVCYGVESTNINTIHNLSVDCRTSFFLPLEKKLLEEIQQEERY